MYLGPASHECTMLFRFANVLAHIWKSSSKMMVYCEGEAGWMTGITGSMKTSRANGFLQISGSVLGQNGRMTTQSWLPWRWVVACSMPCVGLGTLA
jgi:hypothetical protein